MIGIFDSGIGGMTVANAIEKILPDNRIVYFGDLARTPYGSKSSETIKKYAVQNTEFLLSQGAKIIVIACNSAASVASTILKEKFDVPIFEVITPAVRHAAASTRNGRIGVIGTRATIRSNIYQSMIHDIVPDAEVFSQACPLFVPLVEEGWLNKQETKMIVRRYLYPLKLKQVDTLILGCTHYPLLKDLIEHRMGRNLKHLIDSSDTVARELQQYIKESPAIDLSLREGRENLYYVSDSTEAASMIAEKIFGRPITLNKIEL
jgi:glutamate racemase